MPDRRLAHQTRHTISADRQDVRVPCTTYPEVYDDLHDNLQPNAENLTAAQNMCGTCILNQPDVAKPCLREAMDRGDRWVRHVLNRRPGPTITDMCGTKTGADRHYRAGERPCDKCRASQAAYKMEWKRQRKASAA